MEDILISILESVGYEAYRQGSFTDGDKYPEHFFTFWNNSSEEAGYYDNFYSVDPEKTYSVLRAAKKKLKEKSFIIYDSGHDVGSDRPTHTGRGIGVLYMED